MIQRCTNNKDKSWGRYGGRGISVSEAWKKFENFYSDMGSKPEGMSIDRIDNNGNYCKQNCRWSTIEKQNQNKNTYKTNKFGVNGVVYRKDVKKYKAQIGVNKKQITLGLFDSLEDAISARKDGEVKYWNKP